MDSKVKDYCMKECKDELYWVVSQLERLSKTDNRFSAKLMFNDNDISLARIYRDGEWFVTIKGEDARDLLCNIRLYIDGIESVLEIANL